MFDVEWHLVLASIASHPKHVTLYFRNDHILFWVPVDAMTAPSSEIKPS